ncbi:MAG: MFS transporter [Planctomycetales bacterium]|nr:MFS transporter [Planctomycetales bacterium]
MPQTPRTMGLLTVGGFLSFFVFGFVDNLKGALLPEMLRAENWTYGTGASVLLAAYLGFIVATLSAGILSDLIGNQRILLLSGVFLCISLGAVGLIPYFAWQLVAMFVVGVGLGAIEVGANGLMLELHPTAPGRFLNLLATFHGIGSLLVPLYAAGLINAGLHWQSIFLLTSLMAIAMAAPFLWQRQQIAHSSISQSTNQFNWQVIRTVGFTKLMCWYYLLIGSYVAVELGLAAWLVEYLQEARKFSVTSSSLFLSAFFAMIMLGRLSGSMLVDHLPFHKAVGVAIGLGISCIAIGLLGPQETVLLIPMSGLFLSIVFPTVTASVARVQRSNMGVVMGMLFTFGGIGGAVGPWTVGTVSEQLGLPLGLATTIAFGVIALAALGVLAANHPKPQSLSNLET